MQKRDGIHFLHIGKTGGTAIVHALNEHNYCEESPRQARTNHPSIYGLKQSRLDRLAVYVHGHHEDLRDVPEGERVFFFLRDPVSRFMSGFYSRQRQGQPRYDSPWSPSERVAYEHFRTVNELATALSSTNTEEKARAEHAMNSIQHISDTYWRWFVDRTYFLSRLADIFFVGFQEHLEDDFEMLKSKLKLPSEVRLPTDSVLAFRNTSRPDKTLGDEALANLLQWYERDYRFVALCQDVLGPDVLARR